MPNFRSLPAVALLVEGGRRNRETQAGHPQTAVYHAISRV